MAQSMLANLYAKGKQNEKAASKHSHFARCSRRTIPMCSQISERPMSLWGIERKHCNILVNRCKRDLHLTIFVNDPSLQALIADPRFKAAGK